MKVCYIGHEYHKKTGSTVFLIDALREQADSFVRYDLLPEPECIAAFDLEALRDQDFDVICVFQIEFLAQRIADAKLGARLVFVPMYDGCHQLGGGFWARFAGRDDIRVVNFSSTLHTHLMRLGVNSYRFQYFPEPKCDPADASDTVPSAFFWQRTDRPSWKSVKTLLEDCEDLKVHLHLAGDPSLKDSIDVAAEKRERDITVSTWFEDPADYLALMDRTNLYVSPREYEGIGMSFLEAMAAGKCVIAPNNPTMNEYIVHGVNGLLFDVDDPKPLDLSNWAQIGRNARRFIEDGYHSWKWDSETRLKAVFFEDDLGDDDTFAEIGAYARSSASFTPRTARCTPDESLPKVSVAVVCFNSLNEIEPTLTSILSQDYQNMELVVLDGGSNDGTVDLLESYRDRIDVLVSEPDEGVYDAMNKAAKLASGDYVVYINAGDYFHLPTSLSDAMHAIFDEGMEWHKAWFDDQEMPDFIVGNHVYIHADGPTALHHANDFEDTWAQLQTGEFRANWWSGIPCHQATITSRQHLVDVGYDLSFKITADHNCMFTARRHGAKFAHCGGIVATYVGGGLSAQRAQQCIQESYRVSRTQVEDASKVREFYIRNFGIRSTIEVPKAVAADVATVQESGLFYEDWYRMTYMQGDATGLEPIEHYLLIADSKTVKPNPFFDPQYYLVSSSDVAASGVHPFIHYVRHGRADDRPTFDWSSKNNSLSRLRDKLNWHNQDISELVKILSSSSMVTILEALETDRQRPVDPL